MANAPFFQPGGLKRDEDWLGAGEETDPFLGFSAIVVPLDFDLAIGSIPETSGRAEGGIARTRTDHE